MKTSWIRDYDKWWVFALIAVMVMAVAALEIWYDEEPQAVCGVREAVEAGPPEQALHMPDP